MRNYIILTAMIIVGSILAYHFLNHLSGSVQHRVAIAEAERQRQTDLSSLARIQDELKRLATTFQEFQRIHQEQRQRTEHKLNELANTVQQFENATREQPQHTQWEQARLDDMVIDLNNELDNMEEAELAPSGIEQIPREDTEIVMSGEVAERDFGQWMNEMLQNATWDFDTTSQINEQANEALASLPGVTIDDMQCNERFCRATLYHESGELPDTSNLMGKPPFTGDSFTVHEEDGRVRLYFTGPGVKLADLRKEALQAIR